VDLLAVEDPEGFAEAACTVRQHGEHEPLHWTLHKCGWDKMSTVSASYKEGN
jgi:hypothetical protein